MCREGISLQTLAVIDSNRKEFLLLIFFIHTLLVSKVLRMSHSVSFTFKIKIRKFRFIQTK